jgi:hypothetical protein
LLRSVKGNFDPKRKWLFLGSCHSELKFARVYWIDTNSYRRLPQKKSATTVLTLPLSQSTAVAPSLRGHSAVIFLKERPGFYPR